MNHRIYQAMIAASVIMTLIVFVWRETNWAKPSWWRLQLRLGLRLLLAYIYGLEN